MLISSSLLLLLLFFDDDVHKYASPCPDTNDGKYDSGNIIIIVDMSNNIVEWCFRCCRRRRIEEVDGAWWWWELIILFVIDYPPSQQ